MNRRFIAVMLVSIMALLIFIGSSIDVLGVYALEPRVQGFIVYENGVIKRVSEIPLYITLRDVSAILFLAWFLTYISYLLKPSKTHDFFGIAYGVAYVAAHYLYLTFIGVHVVFYPLLYCIHTIGKPLLYLDWGQVIGLITAWRLYRRLNHVRGNSRKA